MLILTFPIQPLSVIPTTSSSRRNTPEPQQLSRGEVVRRLRDRFEPILVFGESEVEAMDRLRKLEAENSEIFVGLKNDFKWEKMHFWLVITH